MEPEIPVAGQLSVDQLRVISALKEHDGFRLLLDALQSEIDTLENFLERPGDHKHLFPFWQALRALNRILVSRLDEVDESLKQAAQTQIAQDENESEAAIELNPNDLQQVLNLMKAQRELEKSKKKRG